MRLIELSVDNKPFYLNVDHLVSMELFVPTPGHESEQPFKTKIHVTGGEVRVDETVDQILKVLYLATKDEAPEVRLYQSPLAAARN